MIVYICIYKLDNFIKGINIDSTILKETIENLEYKESTNFKVKYLNLEFSKIYNYSNNYNNNVPLDGDIYIFPETILYGLYSYLLNNKKYIIFVPNIDSCETYLYNNHPLYRYNYLQLLQFLQKSSFFKIWSKTFQIKNWLNNYRIKSDYIGFCFYNNEPIQKKEINPTILLDTGSSTSNRKYTNEIINIFKDEKIPFKLVVKTTPNVYKKNKFFQYEKYKNIEIINKIVDLKTMNDIYKNHSFLIYISKYDGFGLTLSKSISMGHFIFCLKGEPWVEQLKKYKRKIFINCNKNGTHYFQQKYNADFKDLKKKLYNYLEYLDIINNTTEDVNTFNNNNKNIMFSNIKKSLDKIINK